MEKTFLQLASQTMTRKRSPAVEIVEAADPGEVTKQNGFSNHKFRPPTVAMP